MYRKDYILTMVEQLAQFLARVLFLKETRRLDIAIVEIEDFIGKTFGHTVDELRAMRHDEILLLCNDEGAFVSDKAVALGRLFKELGDIERLQEETVGQPCEYYTRSLVLLLAAYGDGTQALPLDAVDTLDLVIERTAGCELTPDALMRLFRFFELVRCYADAENVLEEMVELGVPGAMGVGTSFYERLLGRDDGELRSGGLSRDDVEEGARALRERGASS